MRLLKLSALALAVETAYGYLDASPFFMFSTSELLSPSSNVQTASSITASISRSLSQCPSDFYILVSQPGVTSSSYASRKHTPTLARHLSSHPSTHSHIRSSLSITDVLGDIDLSSWQAILTNKCKAHQLSIDASTGTIPTSRISSPQAISITFPPPAPSSRVDDLTQHDAFFASILDLLPSSNYTVLYTTSSSVSTPKTQQEYHMDVTDIQESLHMDLKRDLSSRNEFAKRANVTLPEGGLFHKYQFVTPGIYMGFLVGFILLSILYVGVSALSSLTVSYAAFDKDQGQLAAKKAQ